MSILSDSELRLLAQQIGNAAGKPQEIEKILQALKASPLPVNSSNAMQILLRKGTLNLIQLRNVVGEAFLQKHGWNWKKTDEVEAAEYQNKNWPPRPKTTPTPY